MGANNNFSAGTDGAGGPIETGGIGASLCIFSFGLDEPVFVGIGASLCIFGFGLDGPVFVGIGVIG